MFTKLDKALAAALGAFAYFLTAWTGSNFGLTPEVINYVTAFIVGAVPFLVYLVPNKKVRG